MDLIKKYYHLILCLVVFIIYLVTLAPSVVQIDSGELAAVQASLGIAHPTGYPLFSLIGYIFSLIPIPVSVIYKLNILAAIWCTGAVFMFVLSARLMLNNTGLFMPASTAAKKNSQTKAKGKKAEIIPKPAELPETKKIAAITGGAFILAFSKTFWFQSTSVEVYSLQVFLFCLQIYFLLKAYLAEKEDLKQWIIFALVLAAGFSNHMTTLLMLPGTAFLFFQKHGFKKASFIKIGKMLLVFFPVLLIVYSYLLFRAGQNPAINWGNPVDFESIMRHISGKQYQVWLFSSADAAKKQLGYFFGNIFSEFNISLFICLFGLISSYLLARRLFVFLLITFASAVLYSINYDIADIDSYFLLAYIALSFFAVFGIVRIFAVLKVKKHNYSVSAGLTGLFILLQLYFNFNDVNQSGTYTFEDYTKALINSTPNNSVILSYQWDYFISPSYYFQSIENYRKDVAIIDKELLRRSWYYNQIQTNHPTVIEGIRQEANDFITAVRPFERDEVYNPNILEARYQAVMTNLVRSNIGSKNVFIGPELFETEMQQGSFRLPEGYTLVPDLFLFRVVKGNEYVPASEPNFKIRVPERKNHYINTIENFVGSMLVRRAMYELQFDKVDRAKMYIQKVKNDLPDYVIPGGIAGILRK